VCAQALASLFGHSAVLREPLRLFLDAHWQDFVAKAWQHAPGRAWCKMSYIVGRPGLHPGDCDEGGELRPRNGWGPQDHVTPGSYAYGLDGFLRRMCPMLLSICAIGMPASFDGPQFSLALLVALRHIACARVEDTLEQLRHACQVRSLTPSEERRSALPYNCTIAIAWSARDACPAAAIAFLLDAIAPYMDSSPSTELAPSRPSRYLPPKCVGCMDKFLDLPTDIDDDGVEYRYDGSESYDSFHDWYWPNYKKLCCKYALLWAPFAYP